MRIVPLIRDILPETRSAAPDSGRAPRRLTAPLVAALITVVLLVGGEAYAASDHTPLLPSPLKTAPSLSGTDTGGSCC
jgi:hypothetical protein